METEIKRTDIIVIDKVSENDYHDLLFTDKAGKEYRISNKRTKWFKEIIIPEKAVQLHFAEAYGKEYIYRAELVEGNLPPPPPSPPAESKESHIISGQEIGRCWNAIDALYIGGKLATLFGRENAEIILKYYRGILTSTLKLPIDIKKLPQWERKEESN